MSSYIEENSLFIDFRNLSYLRTFIRAHCDEEYPIVGITNKGEHVEVSALVDCVDVKTWQRTGQIRHIVYWIDGSVRVWYE